MKVSIASDHAGFEQKQQLVAYLEEKGYEVKDRGPDSDDRVDYPDYAIKVAMDVSFGRADKGVLICGTGIGMSIVANKIPRVRCANVTNCEFAALSRQHNDANVIALSGRFVDLEENKKILDTFLETHFEDEDNPEGRHAARLKKLWPIEGQTLRRGQL